MQGIIQNNTMTSTEGLYTFTREFGKDITNTFAESRKSLGLQLGKQEPKNSFFGDFKNNFCENLQIKKGVSTICSSNDFGSFNSKVGAAPRQGNFNNEQTKFQFITANSFTQNNVNTQSSNLFGSQPELSRLSSFDSIPAIKGTNIQEVPEYFDSIFDHLKEFERANPHFYAQSGYMKRLQVDINDKMRAILLDWLVEVHLKFKLRHETFFLTINLIDRYLCKKAIQRTQLQLVGVTSMLIACKYEEIYAPVIKDFIFITDKAYTLKEVLAMETEILQTLEYDITMPSSLRFLEFYNQIIKYDKLAYNFMLYLLDLTSIDYKMLKYKSSLLSASVAYVSSKLLNKENVLVNPNIEEDLKVLYEISEYNEDEIKICSKDICLIFDSSNKTGLNGIKKKYSLPKFQEVAKLKFGEN